MSSRNLIQEIIALVSSPAPFTDIHIEEDLPVVVNSPRGWIELESSETIPPVARGDMIPLLGNLDPAWETNIHMHALSRPYELSDWRLRVSAFLASGGNKITLSIRRQPRTPIPLEQTGLPLSIRTMADAPRGLILVSGATGSGKTTTMASIIDYINNTRNAHIVTIEDPVEFVHRRKKSLFSQREVGVDVQSFRQGVKDAMRQKPNVIMIGEIRDAETADMAIQAAESGHLVLASLHANDGVSTVTKMLSFFPEQEQNLRSFALANCLVGIIYQAVLPRSDRSGYALVTETIYNHDRQISGFIADPAKVSQLRGFVDRRADKLSRSFGDNLIELVNKGVIDKLDAIKSITYGRADLYDKLLHGS